MVLVHLILVAAVVVAQTQLALMQPEAQVATEALALRLAFLVQVSPMLVVVAVRSIYPAQQVLEVLVVVALELQQPLLVEHLEHLALQILAAEAEGRLGLAQAAQAAAALSLSNT
jgi:hypothetical protein